MIRTIDQERFKPAPGALHAPRHPDRLDMEKRPSTHNAEVKVKVTLARNTMHLKAIEKR